MKDRRTTALWLVACLGLTGCADDPRAGSSTSTTRDAPVSTEPRPAPTAAELGVPYSFDLYTHCGVRFATFGGQTWETVRPVADPAGTPFARGAVDHLSGTVVLDDVDTLRFTVADDSPVIPGEVVTFEPTTEAVPLCQ